MVRQQKSVRLLHPSPFISPRELAERWQCARSSVDRIATRAGLRRICLSEGRNGMVRYLREEVEAYEMRCLSEQGRAAQRAHPALEDLAKTLRDLLRRFCRREKR